MGCGSSIRYRFTIFHELWGTLEVGTICCDNLTDSEVASNFKESKLKFEGRKQRFVNSKRWIIDGFSHKIKQGPFDIEVFENDQQFSLKINGKTSRIKHKTLIDAKTIVFENIENGQLTKFFKSKNFDFGKNHKVKS